MLIQRLRPLLLFASAALLGLALALMRWAPTPPAEPSVENREPQVPAATTPSSVRVAREKGPTIVESTDDWLHRKDAAGEELPDNGSETLHQSLPTSPAAPADTDSIRR